MILCIDETIACDTWEETPFDFTDKTCVFKQYHFIMFDLQNISKINFKLMLYIFLILTFCDFHLQDLALVTDQHDDKLQ